MSENKQRTPSLPGRAILWTIPRTTATAFVKCMDGIKDCEIWYCSYGFFDYASTILKDTDDVDLPMSYEGNEAVFERAAELLSHRFNAKTYSDRLPLATIQKGLEGSKSQYVFVKDDSLAMRIDERRKFLPIGFHHSFLIRHPTLVFTSLHKTLFLQLKAVGKLNKNEVDLTTFDMRNHLEILDASQLYPSLYELWKYIRRSTDVEPIIVDSSDLLSKPSEVISKYCEALGFPYSDTILKWDGTVKSTSSWKMAGPGTFQNDCIFGVSLSSTNFAPPSQPLPRDQLHDYVIELSEKAMPLYEEMYSCRLKV